jgi:selenocysteine lyase/cysteine desulfurase
MHAALGTTTGGGTVRLSLGFATTADDIDELITALQEVATEAHAH